jgi:hypothetical protein
LSGAQAKSVVFAREKWAGRGGGSFSVRVLRG